MPLGSRNSAGHMLHTFINTVIFSVSDAPPTPGESRLAVDTEKPHHQRELRVAPKYEGISVRGKKHHIHARDTHNNKVEGYNSAI